MNSRRAIALALLCALLLPVLAHAETVATSQLGYHPSAEKRVVSYTTATSGTFQVKNAGGVTVYSGTLAQPRDYWGATVTCQGGRPCLVGDFTNYTGTGNHTIVTSLGGTSRTFRISGTIYADTIPVFHEFFEAMLLNGSAYHYDMYKADRPPLRMMPDGGAIMHTDQAAFTLIRLGNAYRRDPQLFNQDTYNVIGAGLPDVPEHIQVYVDQLISMQGVQITVNGSGIALASSKTLVGAFVPGPTSLTQITLYDGSNQPVMNTTVRSLCGANNGTPAWTACMGNASAYYKCQATEPCLEFTSTAQRGVFTGNSGWGVSEGWGYDFSCTADLLNTTASFQTYNDPCTYFDRTVTEHNTLLALTGFLEAIPAIHARDANAGRALFLRANSTMAYVEQTWPTPGSADDAALRGTSYFLLYDYTNDPTYLQRAHALRGSVTTQLSADITHANEFYWEEYIRHATQLAANGLPYPVGGQDPIEFFRGKLYFDYKDRGQLSISANGERVYQFDPNIQFQNSRYQLIEASMAAKTLHLQPGAEPFILGIADSQLAFLTGQNLLQYQNATVSTNRSMSLIHGIGTDTPYRFHSRMLIDSGYTLASNHAVVGARGMGYKYYNGTAYVWFDGKYSANGKVIGSPGNGQGGETVTSTWKEGRPFKNGKQSIPGWIIGTFDNTADTDGMYNVMDYGGSWQYSETTNEMVGVMLELLAHLDGQRNNRPRAVPPIYVNGTTLQNITLINSTPAGSTVSIAEPNERGFSVSIGNPGGQPVSITWSVNNVTQQQYNNFTYYTFFGNYTSAGTYTVRMRAVAPTNTITRDWTLIVNDTPANISFSTVSPKGTEILLNGTQSQLFTIAVTNPDSVPYAITWTVDGMNQTGAFNQTAFTFTAPIGDSLDRPTPQLVPYRVRATVTSARNTIWNEWTVSVPGGNGDWIYFLSLSPSTPTLEIDESASQEFSYTLTTSDLAGGGKPDGKESISSSTTWLLDGTVQGATGNAYTFPGGTAGTYNVTVIVSSLNTIRNTWMLTVIPANQTCYGSVQDIPATCTGGTITQDTWSGCRTIVCTGGANSLQVLACDKPDGQPAQWFEMYRQAATGTGVRICLLGTCIQDNGFARSPDFPICGGSLEEPALKPFALVKEPSPQVKRA